MPGNPGLAIDGTMPPATRARELRRVWDEFLGHGQLERVRLPIAESWQRSRAAGIDPTAGRAPTMVADRHDVAERWEAHPLEVAAPLIRTWLRTVADEGNQLIVVSDADGLLLWVDGDAKVRSAAADAMNFVEGALWSEVGAGTNAIGTALAADHPVQVHAAEHFNEIVHGWTCSAAPVHDPESGRLLGIVDVTGAMRTAHPHSLAAALATARAVEADLRVRLQERDARLRVRYMERMTSRTEHLALVSRSGRVIADDPDGFVRAERLEIPPDGGAVILPSGQHALAEAVDREDAFIVRALRDTRGSRRHSEPGSPGGIAGDASNEDAPHDMSEWRRAQIELSRLAEEQAALRRVATLVAGETAPEEIFAAVAEEVARIFRADRSAVIRYALDDSMLLAAHWSTDDDTLAVGAPVGLEGGSAAAAMRQSGRPVRLDGHDGLSDLIVETRPASRALSRSTIGAPIVVGSRVWGAILVSSSRSEPFPGDAEARIMAFTELAATAISNAVGRAELAASRARIVATADETRRRIERNLHDGLQQRLVRLMLELRGCQVSDPTRQDLLAELSRVEAEIGAALDELREISRGIHPAILSEGGLEPALRTLARRSAIRVELEVPAVGRLPEPVEVAAYYVVSEALTNAAKHARTSLARVAVEQRNDILHLAIRDEGAGGADLARGSGLIGLRDRVEAIGGTITIESPVGGGTSLFVALPLK